VTLAPHEQLSHTDAYRLGQQVAAGVVLTNAEQLSLPTRTVERGEFNQQWFQHEVQKLLRTAQLLADMSNGSFVGLAHAQLHLTDGLEQPLNLVVVPSFHEGADDLRLRSNVQRYAPDVGFQCVANIQYGLPDEANAYTNIIAGCYSIPPSVQGRQRFATHLLDVEGDAPAGQRVGARRVKGLPAIVPQHEDAHNKGLRAADGEETLRIIVAPDRMDEFRENREAITDGTFEWRPQLSYGGWEWYKDPNSELFVTDALRAAFDAGRRHNH
jgi:hypothetical protein